MPAAGVYFAPELWPGTSPRRLEVPDVSLVFVGDTYVQRADPDSAFAPNLHLFQAADIAFCKAS